MDECNMSEACPQVWPLQICCLFFLFSEKSTFSLPFLFAQAQLKEFGHRTDLDVHTGPKRMQLWLIAKKLSWDITKSQKSLAWGA